MNMIPVRRRPSGLLTVVAIGLALILVFGLWRVPRKPDVDSAAVIREIQQIQEWGAVKYSVQKVVGFREQRVPFGSESLLLVVQGRVVAGVDFSALKPVNVVSEPGGMVLVKLPPSKVLHTYIDEKQTQVWDRSVTWWTPWVAPNPDLERRARLEALRSIEQTALEMGILADADRSTKAAFRNLLRAFKVENVVFEPAS